MTEEEKLIEKLHLIEALFSGASTPGERDAAAQARQRIRARLQAFQATDPPIEYSFTLRDPWSRKLMIALMRRYQIKPYRYPRQRYSTLMARVPKRFVDETLWPEYLELSKILTSYLQDVTDRVIAESIEADNSDVEVRPQTAALGAGTPMSSFGEKE